MYSEGYRLAWVNGWVMGGLKIASRSSRKHRSFFRVYLITIWTPLVLALLISLFISLFAIDWHRVPPQISFINTSHTVLRVFGLVCNFRAAKVKRAGLIESSWMSSYDL